MEKFFAGAPMGLESGLGHFGREGFGPMGFADVFSFTISGTKVSAASITLPSGSKVALPLTTGVSYSVSGADVLAAWSDLSGTNQVRYSDTNANGLMQVVSSAHVFTTAPQVNQLGFTNREALKVTLAGTVVTGVSQPRWDGSSKVLLSATVVPSDTSWKISNGLLVETHTQANGATHWEVFRDGNADGVYTEVANGTGALIDLVGVVAQTNAVAAQL